MRYFKRVDGQGKTTTVEAYSHNAPVPGAVQINKAEYDVFIAALPAIPPDRNLAAELDGLKASLKAKGVID
ncbi:MAG: hypothetical protein A2Z29_04720 [Chloroflexi bacterium RBG_16_56_11]|nr:MAG: hypothetical protein A2Z29_04720 [Chloroflexi bacterium RBG_16_56_11]